MQSSSLGTAPALRSSRLEAEISNPSAVVRWLMMGVFLGIVLTTAVFVALFLMVASANPDGMSLLQAWHGGGYAESPLEAEMAPVELPARVPLDPLITTEGQSPAPASGGAGTAPDAPATASALAPTAAEDGTPAAALLDGSGADADSTVSADLALSASQTTPGATAGTPPADGATASTGAAVGEGAPVGAAAAPPAETASVAATTSQVSAAPVSAAARPTAAPEVPVRPKLRTAGTVTIRTQASSTAASLDTLDSGAIVEALPTEALASSWGWRKVRWNNADGYLPGYMLRAVP
jgi:hypothetical protein